MKIVVIESYTLNPGDLSWDSLQSQGDCDFYERTSAKQLVERCRDAEIVLTNKSVFTADTFSQLPKLRYLGVMATGYNVIEIDAAKKNNVIVTNVPDYGAPSVAQMVFAHVLNLTQRVAHHHDAVLSGKWEKSGDFCFWDYPLVELNGLTLGILGYGNIGKAVAKIALGFGMKVIFHTPHPPENLPENVVAVDLETLFRNSDVLSLHCPLTDETHKIVNAERLAKMKSSALLINTSRGPLIDEAALRNALNNERIAGAGLDVLDSEPPKSGHPLFGANNCIITPHIAWATRASRQRLLNTVVENVQAFLNGKPQNVIHS
ncbi:MAG: D-2-hydroxyacid dehydrogenase [Calditrichae bacterium]|nr:D-2-hydroxyacid dehydrogenase [Calditrichia bacterium]